MKFISTILLILILSINSFSQSEKFRFNNGNWEYRPASTWLSLPLYTGIYEVGGVDGIAKITGSGTAGSPLTFTGFRFKNSVGSNNGHNVWTTGNYLKFEYCFFDSASGLAMYLNTGHDIEITNCLISNTKWGILSEGTTGNIKIHHNQTLNLQWDRVAVGCCEGQVIFYGNASGAGNEAYNNQAENNFGESYNEDLINTNSSEGTSGSHFLIHDNTFRGGGQSLTSGGIIMGDASSAWVDVYNNLLVNPGWYGIQVFGGTQINVYNNDVFSSEWVWSGTSFLVYNGSGTCNNITINSNNNANWDRSPEIYCSPGKYNYDNNGTCTGSLSPGPTSSPSMTPATMGVPDRLIDYVDEDTYWYLRSLKVHYNAVVAAAATYSVIIREPLNCDVDTRTDARRPNANAGTDQSISTSSTTLTSTSTIDASNHGFAFLNSFTNTLAGYSWELVSGPNTPTIVSSTSSSTSVTGLVNGTYVFRLEVTQNNTQYGYDAYDADWITVVVSSVSSTRYKGRIF